MRSIWKGAITFGLVTIPVKLFSATEEKDVSFHQVRRSDGSRVRYKRVAEADGEEVPYAEIAKGYPLPTGEVIVLTDDDFKDLPLTSSRAIDVLQFVPLEDVDPIYFAKSYYLEPEAQGTKPYVLLREALERSGKVALVKVALRSREALGALRVRDGVFVLETMLWPDEIRTPDFGFLDEDIEVREQELAMAGSLIETLSGDFDPSLYKDGYREALQAVIEAKVAGREVVAAPDAQPTSGTVVDLMAALRASVDAARAAREAGGAAAAATDGAAAMRATSAAKSTARAAGTKAGATRAGATRAAATKAAGTKAGATKAGTKAGATKAGAKSAGTKAAGTKAAGTKAAGTKAAGTKAAGTKAAGTKAATAGRAPAKTDARKTA